MSQVRGVSLAFTQLSEVVHAKMIMLLACRKTNRGVLLSWLWVWCLLEHIIVQGPSMAWAGARYAGCCSGQA
eukprot:3426881-Amphidinium_carterae.2